jgi:hypothetical protein
VRRSKAASGFCIWLPWHGEQLREKIAAPVLMRSGGKSSADAAQQEKCAEQAGQAGC